MPYPVERRIGLNLLNDTIVRKQYIMQFQKAILTPCAAKMLPYFVVHVTLQKEQTKSWNPLEAVA